MKIDAFRTFFMHVYTHFFIQVLPKALFTTGKLTTHSRTPTHEHRSDKAVRILPTRPASVKEGTGISARETEAIYCPAVVVTRGSLTEDI